MKFTTAKALADRIFQRYRNANDGDVQGLCAQIVDEICDATGAEPVAGYLRTAMGMNRAHWWAELDGQTLDPMGDHLSAEPGFKRVEAHRSREEFVSECQRTIWHKLPYPAWLEDAIHRQAARAAQGGDGP